MNNDNFNMNDNFIKRHENYPLRRYWNGFDDQGNRRWYIELNNGEIINYRNRKYRYMARKFFENLRYKNNLK